MNTATQKSRIQWEGVSMDGGVNGKGLWAKQSVSHTFLLLSRAWGLRWSVICMYFRNCILFFSNKNDIFSTKYYCICHIFFL